MASGLRVLVGITLVGMGSSPVQGQADAHLDSLLGPHRVAMEALKALDGVWRGKGSILLPSGVRAEFTQTIRVGAGGAGALRVIEGRSYGDDGKLSATNFEIVSYNASARAYALRLYAQGTTGEVPITPTGSGFTLEYPDGGAIMRLTISVANGVWNEVGERRSGSEAPVRVLELSLRRVGDTDWPAGGAVPPS